MMTEPVASTSNSSRELEESMLLELNRQSPSYSQGSTSNHSKGTCELDSLQPLLKTPRATGATSSFVQTTSATKRIMSEPGASTINSSGDPGALGDSPLSKRILRETTIHNVDGMYLDEPKPSGIMKSRRCRKQLWYESKKRNHENKLNDTPLAAESLSPEELMLLTSTSNPSKDPCGLDGSLPSPQNPRATRETRSSLSTTSATVWVVRDPEESSNDSSREPGALCDSQPSQKNTQATTSQDVQYEQGKYLEEHSGQSTIKKPRRKRRKVLEKSKNRGHKNKVNDKVLAAECRSPEELMLLQSTSNPSKDPCGLVSARPPLQDPRATRETRSSLSTTSATVWIVSESEESSNGSSKEPGALGNSQPSQKNTQATTSQDGQYEQGKYLEEHSGQSTIKKPRRKRRKVLEKSKNRGHKNKVNDKVLEAECRSPEELMLLQSTSDPSKDPCGLVSSRPPLQDPRATRETRSSLSTTSATVWIVSESEESSNGSSKEPGALGNSQPSQINHQATTSQDVQSEQGKYLEKHPGPPRIKKPRHNRRKVLEKCKNRSHKNKVDENELAAECPSQEELMLQKSTSNLSKDPCGLDGFQKSPQNTRKTSVTRSSLSTTSATVWIVSESEESFNGFSIEPGALSNSQPSQINPQATTSQDVQSEQGKYLEKHPGTSRIKKPRRKRRKVLDKYKNRSNKNQVDDKVLAAECPSPEELMLLQSNGNPSKDPCGLDSSQKSTQNPRPINITRSSLNNHVSVNNHVSSITSGTVWIVTESEESSNDSSREPGALGSSQPSQINTRATTSQDVQRSRINKPRCKRRKRLENSKNKSHKIKVDDKVLEAECPSPEELMLLKSTSNPSKDLCGLDDSQPSPQNRRVTRSSLKTSSATVHILTEPEESSNNASKQPGFKTARIMKGRKKINHWGKFEKKSHKNKLDDKRLAVKSELMLVQLNEDMRKDLEASTSNSSKKPYSLESGTSLQTPESPPETSAPRSSQPTTSVAARLLQRFAELEASTSNSSKKPYSLESGTSLQTPESPPDTSAPRSSQPTTSVAARLLQGFAELEASTSNSSGDADALGDSNPSHKTVRETTIHRPSEEQPEPSGVMKSRRCSGNLCDQSKKRSQKNKLDVDTPFTAESLSPEELILLQSISNPSKDPCGLDDSQPPPENPRETRVPRSSLPIMSGTVRILTESEESSNDFSREPGALNDSQPSQINHQATTSQNVHEQGIYLEEHPGPSRIMKPRRKRRKLSDKSKKINHKNKLDKKPAESLSSEELQQVNGEVRKYRVPEASTRSPSKDRCSLEAGSSPSPKIPQVTRVTRSSQRPTSTTVRMMTKASTNDSSIEPVGKRDFQPSKSQKIPRAITSQDVQYEQGKHLEEQPKPSGVMKTRRKLWNISEKRRLRYKLNDKPLEVRSSERQIVKRRKMAEQEASISNNSRDSCALEDSQPSQKTPRTITSQDLQEVSQKSTSNSSTEPGVLGDAQSSQEIHLATTNQDIQYAQEMRLEDTALWRVMLPQSDMDIPWYLISRSRKFRDESKKRSNKNKLDDEPLAPQPLTSQELLLMHIFGDLPKDLDLQIAKDSFQLLKKITHTTRSSLPVSVILTNENKLDCEPLPIKSLTPEENILLKLVQRTEDPEASTSNSSAYPQSDQNLAQLPQEISRTPFSQFEHMVTTFLAEPGPSRVNQPQYGTDIPPTGYSSRSRNLWNGFRWSTHQNQLDDKPLTDESLWPEELMLLQHAEASTSNSSGGRQSDQDGKEISRATTSQHVYDEQGLYLDEQLGPSNCDRQIESELESGIRRPRKLWEAPNVISLESSSENDRDVQELYLEEQLGPSNLNRPVVSEPQSEIISEESVEEDERSEDNYIQQALADDPSSDGDSAEHDDVQVEDIQQYEPQHVDDDDLRKDDIQQAPENNIDQEVAEHNNEQIQQCEIEVPIPYQADFEPRLKRKIVFQKVALIYCHVKSCVDSNTCPFIGKECASWRESMRHAKHCKIKLGQYCPVERCRILKLVRRHHLRCCSEICRLCYPMDEISDMIYPGVLVYDHPLQDIIVRIMYYRRTLNQMMLCQTISSLVGNHNLVGCRHHVPPRHSKKYNQLPCLCIRIGKVSTQSFREELEIKERNLRIQFQEYSSLLEHLKQFPQCPRRREFVNINNQYNVDDDIDEWDSDEEDELIDDDNFFRGISFA